MQKYFAQDCHLSNVVLTSYCMRGRSANWGLYLLWYTYLNWETWFYWTGSWASPGPKSAVFDMLGTWALRSSSVQSARTLFQGLGKASMRFCGCCYCRYAALSCPTYSHTSLKETEKTQGQFPFGDISFWNAHRIAQRVSLRLLFYSGFRSAAHII